MDFKPCKNCTNGFIIVDDTAKKCECFIKWQTSEKVNYYKELSGINKSFNLDFDSYIGPDLTSSVKKLKAYVRDYKQKYSHSTSLYLYGGNGTQKSTLAKVVAIELMKKDVSSKFILFGDLLNLLTKAEQDVPSQGKISALINSDLLIIDDCFSKSKSTIYSSGYQLAFIDRFLRYRMESLEKNIIFTSNTHIQDIEKAGFNADIQNLMYREIQFKGGLLEMNDQYTVYAKDFDVKSLWD